MTPQAILTLIILLATLLLLASRRVRADLTALMAMLALILTGVLTPAEAFGAFGQSVIFVVASIYVLGAAIYDTGVATLMANQLLRVSDRGQSVLLLVIMLAAGLMSGFLGSLLVVAALMPAVLRIVRRANQAGQARISPALLLLPMVAGATMGNLLTVIGTVSNLVVSDLLVASGHEPLGFFQITPYGLVSLGLAIAWYLLIGQRLLRRQAPAEPETPSLDQVERAYRLDRQLYRLRLRSASDLAGRKLEESDLQDSFGLNVLAVKRADGLGPPGGSSWQPPAGSSWQPPASTWVLDTSDVLLVEGQRGDVLQAASLHQLEPKGTMSLQEFNQLEGETLRLAELMVPFRSQLVGRTLAQARFRERYGLNILAVHRQGQAIHDDLAALRLEAGDTLLVQGPRTLLRRIGRDLNLVLVTHLGPRPGDLITSKAKLTLGILALMVLSIVTGLLPLAVATLAAAVLLVLSGCLSLGRAYRAIDGSVLVLIGGMLPLALALEKTGIAELTAGQIASLSATIGPLGGLLLLYLVTSLLTQIVSNSVTAALMTPIAISLAAALGLSPTPFAIAIAVAVVTSYATPLTNADNLLVRDAGRYTMRDYVINGLPFFVLQTAALIFMLAIWM